MHVYTHTHTHTYIYTHTYICILQRSQTRTLERERERERESPLQVFGIREEEGLFVFNDTIGGVQYRGDLVSANAINKGAKAVLSAYGEEDTFI